MNILLIFLVLFFGIDGSNVNGVDVLERLKVKNILCDLHDFVKSSDNSEDEYQVLIHDLRKYCSNSEATQSYQLLCRMILIELEIGCLLPNNSRPTPIKYTLIYTAKQICSMSKIPLTNSWIWEKLSLNERNQIGSTPLNLCSRITSMNETLRLVRFFYKMASRIRRSETVNSTSLLKKDSSDSLVFKIRPINGGSLAKTNDSNLGLIEQENQPLINDIPERSKVLNQTVKQTDAIQEQLALKTNKTKSDGIIDDSVDAEDEVNNEKNEPMLHNRVQEPVRSKKEDKVEIKSENISKTEEGFPLGRAGEKPEREQMNERPKPKVLDVESVFKADNHQERNWVEGKNIDRPVDNRLNANLHNLHRMKYEENPLINSPSVRKRSSFKLKLSRHLGNDDNDDASNSAITSILIFTLCIVIIYLILHNKNKILGLIIEGCKRRRGGNNRHSATRHTRLSPPSD